jgi:hypothetical protein
VVGAVTFLEAGCLLGVACLGRAAVPLASFAPSASVGTPREAPRADAPAAEPETLSSASPEDRDALASPDLSASDETEAPAPARTPRAPRTESEFLRDLLSRTGGDAAALEAATRSALAGDGPDCEKVAALKAVVQTRSPAADDLLASAVESLLDRSSPNGESVPRFALRLLAERAPREAGARVQLLRLAYVEPLDRGLRASAASAYSLAADEGEIRGLVAALANETDPLVRAGALEALGRNPHTRAADAVLAQLGAERSVPDEQE